MKHIALLLLMGSLITNNTYACNGSSTSCIRLGIEMSPVDNSANFPKMQSDFGVLVTQITPNSLAEKMHLATGDIIKTINGQDILNTAQLEQIMSKMKIGETVEMKIARNGKEKTLYAKIKS